MKKGIFGGSRRGTGGDASVALLEPAFGEQARAMFAPGRGAGGSGDADGAQVGGDGDDEALLRLYHGEAVGGGGRAPAFAAGGGRDDERARETASLLPSGGGGAAAGDDGSGKEAGGAPVYEAEADDEERRAPMLDTAWPAWDTLRIVATILKVFIGSGVLFLPRAFANGGWAFSVGVMAAMALITNLCILRLVRCREIVQGSYGHVGRVAVGRWGQVAVDTSLLLCQGGFCCVYVVFIARNVLSLLNARSCWLGLDALPWLIAAQWLVFTPLTWVRHMRQLHLPNLFAVALVSVCLSAIVGWAVAGIVSEAGKGVAVALPAFNAQSFALFLGTGVYAYEGVGMVVPVYDSLSQKQQRRFPVTLSATVFGVAFIYITVGVVPYVYLDGMVHAVMQDSVTLNLPREVWAYVIQAAYCVVLVLTYPLQLFPAMRILERAAGKTLAPTADSSAALVARRNAFRGAVVAATLAISLVGAEQLNNFVALIGCFCCTPLAFIYPSLFHLRLVPRAPAWSKALDCAIIVFGVGIFFFSTYEAIATWSASVISACPDLAGAAAGGGSGALSAGGAAVLAALGGGR